ncbi:MAG: M28 family peptidase [Candidatus Lokiarchaeota archaeon]|nr:M28 family peptidase [Candidatus Lokiarchaeota archaeon]
MTSENKDEGKYLHNRIKEIVETIGPGQPGSKGEEERGQYFYEHYKKTKPDNLEAEEYTFAPNAFLDWIPTVMFLYIAVLIIMITRFFLPYFPARPSISLGIMIMVLVGFTIAFEEFLSYKEFIDPLFPKETAENIIATFKPTQEKKAVLIISGHHDSAREFFLIYKFKQFYAIVVLISLILLFLEMFLSIWNTIWDFVLFFGLILEFHWAFAVSKVLTIIILCLLPISIFMFWFTGDNVVPGAMDNLSGSVTTLGVARWLKDPENRPKFIEVRTISFGGEEAGLRGSRRYARRHEKELQRHAYILNYDGISKPGVCRIIKGEHTTRTYHDKEWANFVAEAVKNADIKGLKEINVENAMFGRGGSDSVSFTRINVPATTIQIMPKLLDELNYYHTRRDTPDKVSPNALYQGLSVSIAVIKKLEEKYSTQ